MLKKNLLILTLILFSIPLMGYQSSKIKEAAQYYKQQKYNEALNIYIKKDKTNPYILYNIANCYYKMGDTTHALIYYLKAFKILPRNKDIKHNLIITARQTSQDFFPNNIPRILYNIFYFLSDYEIISIMVISFFLLSVVLLMNMLSEKGKNITSVIILLFLFTVSGIWHLLRENSITYNTAVVLKETSLYSGPSENFNKLATIPEAKLIKIISSGNDDYMEVGIYQDNIKGWIKSKDVEKI
jgi:tetratricopeptide (TPR) repeat protein